MLTMIDYLYIQAALETQLTVLTKLNLKINDSSVSRVHEATSIILDKINLIIAKSSREV